MLEDKVKIKVSIAGRTYPLNVTEKEEEHVRRAVKFIEERIKIMKEKYDIKDIQDIQALMLLELASELDYLKRKEENDRLLLKNKLDQLLKI